MLLEYASQITGLFTNLAALPACPIYHKLASECDSDSDIWAHTVIDMDPPLGENGQPLNVQSPDATS